MRTISRFALLWMVSGATLAIGAPPESHAPTKADAPPPPAINDPGVTASKPTAGAPADAAAPADARATTDPLAPLPKPDTRLVRDRADRDPNAIAHRMAASEHTVRKQGTDTVDEYRENGKVWMIHI